MEKIVFVAKTNLNNDGRILNQLKILEKLESRVSIDFILLPDKPLKIDLGTKVQVHIINSASRHKKYLRFLTVIGFTLKSLILLIKLRPSIVHAEDSAVVFPVLFYRLLKGKNFRLIYDDHELPDEDEGIGARILTFFEVILMKKADHVIFANEERLKILQEKHHLKNKCSVFLNLPYFEDKKIGKVDTVIEKILSDIDILKKRGVNFIIHQGFLENERGRKKLANFSKILPINFKILIIGETKDEFDTFIFDFNLNPDFFYFVGNVQYFLLPEFWNRAIASIVMYLPKYINNRYCAPNRFYISIEKGLPVIVNIDNPVLSNFVNKYKCGFFIENFKKAIDFLDILKLYNNRYLFSFNDIKDEQIDNFLLVYKR